MTKNDVIAKGTELREKISHTIMDFLGVKEGETLGDDNAAILNYAFYDYLECEAEDAQEEEK